MQLEAIIMNVEFFKHTINLVGNKTTINKIIENEN